MEAITRELRNHYEQYFDKVSTTTETTKSIVDLAALLLSLVKNESVIVFLKYGTQVFTHSILGKWQALFLETDVK